MDAIQCCILGKEIQYIDVPPMCFSLNYNKQWQLSVNRPVFGGTVPHFHQMFRVPRNETDVPHF